MINKEIIQTLTEEWLQGNEYFLVDVNFAADDRIVIEIDHADGVWIEDCAELSRFLQERLGDELGEYELEVGSAGLGQPFATLSRCCRPMVRRCRVCLRLLTLQALLLPYRKSRSRKARSAPCW